MKQKTFWTVVAIAMLALSAWLVFGGGTLPVLRPKVSQVTFVYEKNLHVVHGPVQAALDKLNRERGIDATIFEHEMLDGTGSIPDQYKIAHAKAKEVGMPVLVVQVGDKVIKVVKDPKTEKDVLEAVP